MCDNWLNDCLAIYIEKNMFDIIFNDEIMQNYQNMKTHKEVL
jgi:hypothetical protein